MKDKLKFKHEFVNHIPEILEEKTLYVSIDYAVAVHRCACGCGEEITTSLSPKNWILIFDGDTVSIHPSIGNWSLPCQSHYWIERNKIVWAEYWSKEQIASVREHDRRLQKFWEL